MKTIKIKPNTYFEDNFHFWNDCENIVKAFLNNGYVISLTQAKELWDRYSDSMEAGWIALPKNDDDIISCVKKYFEEVE